MTTTVSPQRDVRSDHPIRPRHPRRTRFVVLALVVLVAGLAVVRFITAGPPNGRTTPPARPSPTAGDPLAELQSRTLAEPESPTTWLAYGVGALQAATVSGDPSHYAVADRALMTAGRLAPDLPELLAARAALALAVHDFAGALPLAEQAVEADPFDASALAALVDARVETGDYRGAETALEQLLRVDPGVAAYARVSYLRQLAGDLDGARTAMRQAVAASSAGAEQVSVLIYLGDIELELGELSDAAAAYERALASRPEAIHAELGRARVMIAEGRLDEAADRVAALVARSPQPAAATLQGELALLRGDQRTAEDAFALVDANDQILRSQGVATDLESAIFSADRGLTDRATTSAEAAYELRRTVFTADALAWARFGQGRLGEAVELIEEALADGITTPSIRVHAAAIFAAAGDLDRARDELTVAFRSAPWSTLSIRPVAARLADQLGVQFPQEWSL